ncbi:hypothetical protein LP419_17990 [Massilia sp. H-1]|nr:hypothetical protein LP419_17990 [Massilia sp. H-1]
MSEYAVKGNTTFGSVVDEQFAVKDGKAVWKSTSEQGQTASNGGAMYVPLNSTLEVVSIAISAMAARNNGPLPLLPSGALSQQRARRSAGDRQRQERQGAAAGDDGPGPVAAIFLGHHGRQTAPVRHGRAGLHDGGRRRLGRGRQGAGRAPEDGRSAPAQGCRRAPAAQARGPDGGQERARVRQRESGARRAVRRVRPARAHHRRAVAGARPCAAPRTRSTAPSRVMLPGLFDMHGHVGRWEGGMNIARRSVTTVRDMGNDNATMQQILDETAA